MSDAHRLPLDGVVAVAIEQAVAVPFATRQLADLGARVIKLERPRTGDFARDYDHAVSGVSAYFAWLNRSKESVEVDLKSDEGLELTNRLIARADVFAQNLAPGVAKRLGIDARSLRARHPRLVACDLSGFGTGGPYGDRKAYDLLIQAETGLISINGTPESPSKVGISVADISGGMYAFSGILTALYRRERTGEGAALEISLLDGLAEWMGQPAYQALYGSGPPPRTGARHASIAPYGPFATATGTIVLGVHSEHEWRRFCEVVLENPALADDERFTENARRVEFRAALEAEIDRVLKGLTSDEVKARLDAADIASAVERGPRDLRNHPQLAARDRWRVVDGPDGPVDALLPPIALDGQEARMGAIPRLGEHTESVLRWLDRQPVHTR